MQIYIRLSVVVLLNVPTVYTSTFAKLCVRFVFVCVCVCVSQLVSMYVLTLLLRSILMMLSEMVARISFANFSRNNENQTK